ncbi:FtsX-like permease family protein [Eshraghiella crossota]|uniref:FtsX-like permease family protein n=1 Tax=Eshraghiella crossota TaxID=45851 RepID=UPI003AB2C1EC
MAIFYVFNSLSDQAVMLKINESNVSLIDTLGSVMSVISVFVAVVLGFLIVYANTFLIKRRNKEFGIYLILGMGKVKVAAILIIETVVIGIISMAAGLIVGIAASQGMSILIANLFEADLTKFRFVVSKAAIMKTILYFCIMYGVVLILDIIVSGSRRLINLINSGKKGEKEINRNPVLCVIVFIIACILLGTAYYKVTAGMENIDSVAGVAAQIVKGIVGTFLLMFSISGLFLLLVRAKKKFYYKKLNAFTTREISSKINTAVFSAGIISLMMFFSICCLSTVFSVKKSIDNNIKKLIPVDIQYETLHTRDAANDPPIDELVDKLVKDKSNLEDMFTVNIYDMYDNDNFYYNRIYEYMHVSEYNKVARRFGNEEIELKDDEYAVIGNMEQVIGKNYLKPNGAVITINGKEYKPQSENMYYGFVFIDNYEDCYGKYIVPDDVDFSDAEEHIEVLMADLKGDKKTYKDTNKKLYFDDVVDGAREGGYYMNVYCKYEIINVSTRLTVVLVFVGIYLGIVFIITGAAILSLKLLSESVRNKEKYTILRKIGVDNRMIRKSVFTQCMIYFGLPLSVAVIHSVFGIQTCTKILGFYGKSGLLYSILITALIFVLIYGGYALATYLGSIRILSEKQE